MTDPSSNPDELRGPIEEQYNELRDGLWSTFQAAKDALEADLRYDLAVNEAARSAALVAAGLGSRGEVPSNYPESSDPENSVAPTITGEARIGVELTADPGTWSGSPSFVYRWERADADGSGRVTINGATTNKYTLVQADVGKIVRVTVTATNVAGSHSASSDDTTEVLPLAPTNTELPSITGTTTVGQDLTAHDGTWTGSPTIVRQWIRADDNQGTNAVDIPGAQGETYTLVGADQGKYMRLLVTGTNDGGQTTVQSAYTTVVAGA